jgi:VWFA-related protein
MILSHGGRVYNIQAPPPPPPQEGILLPPPRPTNDAAGRIFVLFIDDLHMDFQNTGRLRDLVKKISRTLIHDGDLWGAVSSGPSSIAQDLTYDHKRLDELIKKISGSGLKPNDIIQGGETSEGPTEVRYRAHVAFSTMYDFLKNLEAVRDRRKAVIYISDGYDFNPFVTSRTDYQNQMSGRTQQSTDSSNQSQQQNQDEDPFLKQGQEFADADLMRELAELTRAANRANTSLYTIDPRGLVGMPDLDQTVDQTDWMDYIRKSQDSLRVLAENTGGIAVVNQNDFDKALKRIDNETSDYYVLGYYSSNPDPTIRTRKLELKVKRPDVSVYSRQSYTLKRQPAVK